MQEKQKKIDTPSGRKKPIKSTVKIISERLAKQGYELSDCIGEGSFGKVFNIENHPKFVCKITRVDTEVAVANVIKRKGKNFNCFPKIKQLYFTKVDDVVYYIIILEKLTKLSTSESNVFYKTFPNKILFFAEDSTLPLDINDFIQAYALKSNVRTSTHPDAGVKFIYRELSRLKDFETKEAVHEMFNYISYNSRNPEFATQFINIIKGLDFLKENNISYADIAPRNIMKDDNGRFKIIDFGYSYLENAKKTKIDEI